MKEHSASWTPPAPRSAMSEARYIACPLSDPAAGYLNTTSDAVGTQLKLAPRNPQDRYQKFLFHDKVHGVKHVRFDQHPQPQIGAVGGQVQVRWEPWEDAAAQWRFVV